jgi:hypothetical protein
MEPRRKHHVDESIAKLDSTRSELHEMELHVEEILKTLKKEVPMKYTSRATRTTLVSDSLSVPEKSTGFSLERTRTKDWMAAQIRSEAILKEHSEWSSKFDANRLGLL